jgi:hypothetical protein
MKQQQQKKSPNFFGDLTEEKRDPSRTDIINFGVAKLNTLVTQSSNPKLLSKP